MQTGLFTYVFFFISFVFFKDIATKVIAKQLNLEETPVSKVMTKNPVFVLSDTIAVEALQKMVQGLLFLVLL
jgi:CBS domain-containing protein